MTKSAQNDADIRFSLLELDPLPGSAPQTPSEPDTDALIGQLQELRNANPVAPAPTPQPPAIADARCSWARVTRGGNDWGIRVETGSVTVGDRVRVTRKNGRTSVEYVGDFVRRDRNGCPIHNVGSEPETTQTAPQTEQITRAVPASQVAEISSAAPAQPASEFRAPTMVEAAAISSAMPVFATWVATAYEARQAELARQAAAAAAASQPQTLGAQLRQIQTASQARARLATSRRNNPRQSRNRRNATAQQVRRAQRRNEIALSLTSDDTALGIVCDWRGRGELTVSQCTEILTDSNLPLDLAPKGLTPKAALGKAIGLLRARGHSCNYQRNANQSDNRRYISRYSVGTVDHGSDLGESLGSKDAIATLWADGTLELQGPEYLCGIVRAEYDRVVNGHVLTAGKVTQWIQSVLMGEFDAVSFGPAWLVPAPFDAAETFVNRCAQSFGTHWYDKAPRLTTAESIGANVAGGLVREIDAIAEQMTNAETQAAGKKDKDGNPQTIRESTATGYLSQLNDIADRAKVYRAVLDQQAMDRVAAKARELISRCEKHASATAQRGALIWDELRRDPSVDWA